VISRWYVEAQHLGDICFAQKEYWAIRAWPTERRNESALYALSENFNVCDSMVLGCQNRAMGRGHNQCWSCGTEGVWLCERPRGDDAQILMLAAG
jgi:hypothetical protein